MREFALTLALAGLSIGSAAPIQAATIAVHYSVTGSIHRLGIGAEVETFIGYQQINYQGSGFVTLSHGPVDLVNGYESVASDVELPGVFRLTQMSSVVAAGAGSWFSNGAFTAMLARVTVSGFLHCFDLTPLGCQSFAMLPASVMQPRTGLFSHLVLAGNLGLGQPPFSFTLTGMNFGGVGTNSIWTFSEIPGSRFYPEPATGALLGVGVAAIALAGRARQTRQRSRSARPDPHPSKLRRAPR